jgi:hypothetical protein
MRLKSRTSVERTDGNIVTPHRWSVDIVVYGLAGGVYFPAVCSHIDSRLFLIHANTLLCPLLPNTQFLGDYAVVTLVSHDEARHRRVGSDAILRTRSRDTSVEKPNHLCKKGAVHEQWTRQHKVSVHGAPREAIRGSRKQIVQRIIDSSEIRDSSMRKAYVRVSLHFSKRNWRRRW